MDLESWAGSIDLNTRAAELLRKLVAVLPQNREFTITVFGSAPIQICVDSSLTSADVDVFSDFEFLREIVETAGLGQDKASFYIQVSSEQSANPGAHGVSRPTSPKPSLKCLRTSSFSRVKEASKPSGNRTRN